jgi:DNA-binding transcriptional LysR family regulator
VVPHGHVLADLAYYLVTPAEQAESEALREFREWLVEQVQAVGTSAHPMKTAGS